MMRESGHLLRSMIDVGQPLVGGGSFIYQGASYGEGEKKAGSPVDETRRNSRLRGNPLTWAFSGG